MKFDAFNNTGVHKAFSSIQTEASFYVAQNASVSHSRIESTFDECNAKAVCYNHSDSFSVDLRFGVSRNEMKRIYNAANRIKCDIIVVGSRANGTAQITSDWDYIIEGLNNRKWKKIKNSIPGAKDFDRPIRDIDIVHTPLDKSRPYIIVSPSLLLNKLLGNVP